jgi:integral membrane sensor domain MASE1
MFDFSMQLFHRKLFGTLCVLASLVISVLLAVYLSVWDKQNLAGWTQFSIFTAVFFVFGFEGVRTLVDANAMNVKITTSCQVIGMTS